MKRTGNQYTRRLRRVRATAKGSAACPRLSVFRSLRHLSVQLIDDTRGVTLASASDREIAMGKTKGKVKEKAVSRREHAEWVGGRIAERALEKNIRRVKFDRGAYRYHGLVAAVAEGARRGGLKF